MVAKQGILVRESSFELIRVIAQFMIVLYHLLFIVIYPYTNIPFYKAIWVPLHIGVPLFVMLSGYFGIKADLKRLVNLIGMIFVLQVPLLLLNMLIRETGGGICLNISKLAFCISNTPYWFIKTYIYLFLFSPIINIYIQNCSTRQRILLLAVLFFISEYMGAWGTDSSLSQGKNLVTFIFFYVVGNTLHKYKHIWSTINKWKIFAVFIIMNIITVSIFSKSLGHGLADDIFDRFFYGYNSIYQLISAITFFVFIGSFHFSSQLVNRIGKSSLAIYIIHETPLLIYGVLPIISFRLYDFANGSVLAAMFLLSALALMVVISCWIAYEILTPIWIRIGIIGGGVQLKFNRAIDRFSNFIDNYFNNY